MRVMVIIKANKESEAGVLPDEKLLTEMGNYNEELVKAGVMLAGEGLHPSSQGKRIHFSGTTRKVTDGPFAETKEVVGGYWFIVARSLEEAVALAAQNPCLAYGLTVEIRPVELARASVLVPANETPAQWGAR